MTRYEILRPVLQEELEKPYIYGLADCFMLGCQVADAFDASRDLVGRYGGTYTTLAGAQKALRRHGHKSLVTFFETHLTPIGPASAQVGDIVVIVIDGGEHVGVCLGASGRFVTKTADGPTYHRVSDCIAAFRV
ncbi:DUF6950 family protein [Ochrobactrum soli]|uniref:DUF6950 domain-containing protein n=1 Tax=Ochrobactrum soli TaxID=2448455 RepID=A0A2P9HHK8_9HYPH|nr:hypothetical protein [[Ochrobactrum] soli]SPL63579.1 hypothetical protein OHAE_3511 [[Ochrobactrum] soli]